MQSLIVDSLIIGNTLFDKDIREVVRDSKFITDDKLKTDISIDALAKMNQLNQTLSTLKTSRRAIPTTGGPETITENREPEEIIPGWTSLIKSDGKDIAYIEMYDIDANGNMTSVTSKNE